MFGFVFDLAEEVIDTTRYVARTATSPVTETIEEITDIPKNTQDEIIEDIAIDMMLGSIVTKLLD